jgi:hypothetical protein
MLRQLVWYAIAAAIGFAIWYTLLLWAKPAG